MGLETLSGLQALEGIEVFAPLLRLASLGDEADEVVDLVAQGRA